MAWLRDLGAEGLGGLRVARSPGRGRAVFAARDFEPGEVLCRVPGEAILAAPPAGEADADTGDPAGSPEALLAAKLLQEKHRGRASPYWPYIASLPGAAELAPAHPLFWPPEVRPEALLHGSAHGRRLAEEAIRDGAARAAALAASGVATDEAEARWALAVVDSRAFTFQPDQPGEQLALIPLLDMLNTFSLLKDGEPLWQCAFEADGEASEGGLLAVERPIRAGDEVLHMYSHNSSAMLWMVYGFLDDGDGENPCEMAAFELDLDRALAREPPALAAAKLAALARHPAGGEPRPRRWLFELPDDGQSGGLLLPVARLLACESVEEVGVLADDIFAAVASGAAPKDLGIVLEVRARELVAAWLREALAESDAAAAALSQEEPPGGDTLRRLAGLLLRRERPVLELELHASEGFCDAAAAALREGGSALEAFKAERWDDATGWLGAG